MNKKRRKSILIPEAEESIIKLRYELVKSKGWLDVSDENWWNKLSPIQKSIINGEVTKMMVIKAQTDWMEAYKKNMNNKDNK